MKTITIREHQTASVFEHPCDGQLSVLEATDLDRAQRTIGIEAFRWSGRNQIRSADQVGMIATAHTRLEILPKIEGLETWETRGVLIRMIAVASDLPVWDGEITSHEYQDRDLLELLIGLFARRLQQQVRAGLSRAYRRREDDLSLLRGKLNVTRQFTKLAASPQKLACRYDEFTADTGLNRLLHCAAIFLRSRSARADTQRLLNEISAHFEDVSLVSVSAALLEPAMLDRGDRRWSTLAKLARLLLSKAYQTTHSGPRDGVAIVFDMNLLFEAYIAAIARRVCAHLCYKVSVQGPLGNLAVDSANSAAFRTKPDLYVESGAHRVLLDTKWKHIDPSGPNSGIAQADAYQMNGYAHVYRTRSTILLYPHHKGFNGAPGVQAVWHFATIDAVLILATIDIAKLDESEAAIRLLLAESASRSGKDGGKGGEYGACLSR